MSASEVSRAAGIAQPRVAAALKDLKAAKRIYQGGNGRSPDTPATPAAEAASTHARKTASGPVLKPAKKK